jgi:hypothetical protein
MLTVYEQTLNQQCYLEVLTRNFDRVLTWLAVANYMRFMFPPSASANYKLCQSAAVEFREIDKLLCSDVQEFHLLR